MIWGFPGLPDIERANCFFILLSKDIRHYNICIIYIYILQYTLYNVFVARRSSPGTETNRVRPFESARVRPACSREAVQVPAIPVWTQRAAPDITTSGCRPGPPGTG